MTSKDEEHEKLRHRAAVLMQEVSPSSSEISALTQEFKAWAAKHGVKPMKRILKGSAPSLRAEEEGGDSSCPPFFHFWVGRTPIVCMLEKDFGGGTEGEGCLYMCF